MALRTAADVEKPRVLFLTSVPGFYGGAERVLMDLLDNPEIVPVLALPEPGPLSAEAERRGLTVEFYWPGAIARVRRPLRLRAAAQAALDAVRCGREVRRIASRNGCGVVHSNSLKTHFLLGVVRALGRPPFCVVHLHDIAHSRIEKAVWWGLRACADRLIVVSRPCWPTRRTPAKLAVVPNGLRLGSAEPPSRRPGRPLRLGFVGRFHPHKGLEVLADWFAAARAAGIDCRLTLRGRADPASEAYWQTFLARLRELGLDAHTSHEGWREADTVYEDLDVVVVPSRLPDPLPRVVMEAMGAAIPVIAYPSGGIPTMIASGETGYLAATPEEFVRSLTELSASGQAYDRVRCAGFRHVRGSLTKERFLADVNAVYRDGLRASAGAGGRSARAAGTA